MLYGKIYVTIKSSMVFLRFLFTVRIENIFRYGGLVWDAEWDPLVLTGAGDHWKRMLPRSNVGEPTPKWTPWKRRSTCLQNIRCRDILRRDLVEAIKVRVLLFSSMIAVRFLRASYAYGAGTGETQNSRSTRRRRIEHQRLQSDHRREGGHLQTDFLSRDSGYPSSST